MPAITSVEVDGFRCFRRLRVEGLTPVNLIVGQNGAGKTALLEAIEAVASEESPYLAYRASVERGEIRRVPPVHPSTFMSSSSSSSSSSYDAPGFAYDAGFAYDWADPSNVQIDLRHWFYDHQLDDGAAFAIRANVAPANGNESPFVRRRIHRTPADPSAPLGRLMLATERRGSLPSRSVLRDLPLTHDGFLGAGAPSSFLTFGLQLAPPVGFVTTSRLYPSELAALWTKVVFTASETRVVDALKLIEPSIERLTVVEANGTTSAIVLLHGASGPVPLGSLGEGVARLLNLALYIEMTRGGTLLLDEIEIGLHWSVMTKYWQLLVESAERNNVQVFATTHSKDCLEALARLHGTSPTLASRVSVHRLERGRSDAVRFDASRIAEYVAMELEAR